MGKIQDSTINPGKKTKIRELIDNFGLPRLIIAGFLLALFILAPIVGADLPTQITNTINRFSWNAVLVLAMVPMVHSGCGLNFGLPLGIISGLLGATMSIQFGFTGPVSFFMAILIATPFALIFGGDLKAGLAAAAAGVAANAYLLFCGRHGVGGGFRTISTAALITLCCILGCGLLGTESSHAIIGTLMILTPGIAFTMGIRDFVQGDYLSGTIRMIDALLIAASTAIGTGLVLSLYAFLKGVAVV